LLGLGEGKADGALRTGAAGLMDEGALAAGEPPVAHGPLREDPRAAVDGVAHADVLHDLPVEPDERQDGQGRLLDPPAQPDRHAERQRGRDAGGRRGRLARQAELERHVRLGDGDGRRLADLVDLDVLEVRALHAHRRFSTMRSVSPCCTTSSRWLTMVRSIVTRPRSGLSRSFFAATFARSRMVSPILTGALNFQRSPARPSVAYSVAARLKSP